jgi:NDMA-dependent alcohol dehydrogenase
LCHSDEHLQSSEMGSEAGTGQPVRAGLFPMVGGHEGGGVVLEVGPDVTSLQPGDHVAASFFPICGRCRMCITGHSNLCDLGAATFLPGQISDGTVRYRLDGRPLNVMSKLGTFAEHSVCHEASLVQVDADLPLTAVALVSCGVATGWGSAVYRAEVMPGDTVVVVGVGGIGMNAVQGAKAAGAKFIVAVDPVEFKREIAPTFGATHTAVDAGAAIELVKDLTWGVMADRVVLTPGVVPPDLILTAMMLLRKGGTCVLTGMAKVTDMMVPLILGDMVSSCKTLKGMLYGGMNPRDAMPMLLSMYEAGNLKLDELVTQTYKLDDINEAMKDLRAGKNIRGVIAFG